MNASDKTAIFLRKSRRKAMPRGLWARPSVTASSWPMRISVAPAIPNPWVDQRVHDVYGDAGDDEQAGADHDERHYSVVVPAVYRLQRQQPDARDTRQRLDEEGALQQPDERERDDRA